MSELVKKRCIPCEGGVPALTKKQAEELLKQVKDWSLVDEAHLLAKSFRFKDFAQAMAFANKVAAIAEEENHHPDLAISWGSVTVELMTHAVEGLSENDFIVASKVDQIKR